jgi:uncharacterized RDD family membrane protein YckC
MITRVLAFLTDLILFLLVYCFLFVSVIILLFDRNTDYSRFIPAFYSIMAVLAYGYFIVPILLYGRTLGKRMFRITVLDVSGWKTILLIHLKYIVFRLFPIIAILLLLQSSALVLQLLFGLIAMYPIFDYIYLKATEHTFTDQLLHLSVKIY